MEEKNQKLKQALLKLSELQNELRQVLSGFLKENSFSISEFCVLAPIFHKQQIQGFLDCRDVIVGNKRLDAIAQADAQLNRPGLTEQIKSVVAEIPSVRYYQFGCAQAEVICLVFDYLLPAHQAMPRHHRASFSQYFGRNSGLVGKIIHGNREAIFRLHDKPELISALRRLVGKINWKNPLQLPAKEVKVPTEIQQVVDAEFKALIVQLSSRFDTERVMLKTIGIARGTFFSLKTGRASEKSYEAAKAKLRQFIPSGAPVSPSIKQIEQWAGQEVGGLKYVLSGDSFEPLELDCTKQFLDGIILSIQLLRAKLNLTFLTKNQAHRAQVQKHLDKEIAALRMDLDVFGEKFPGRMLQLNAMQLIKWDEQK